MRDHRSSVRLVAALTLMAPGACRSELRSIAVDAGPPSAAGSTGMAAGGSGGGAGSSTQVQVGGAGGFAGGAGAGPDAGTLPSSQDAATVIDAAARLPDAGAPLPLPSHAVLGFEGASGWTVERPMTLVLTSSPDRVEGTASLSFDVGPNSTSVELKSGTFAAADVGPPADELGFSIWVAVAPGPSYQPYVHWDLACIGGGDYIGGGGLLALGAAASAWKRLDFDVKASIRELFERRLSGCSISLRFDNLRGAVRLDGISFQR